MGDHKNPARRINCQHCRKEGLHCGAEGRVLHRHDKLDSAVWVVCARGYSHCQGKANGLFPITYGYVLKGVLFGVRDVPPAIVRKKVKIATNT